MEACGGGGDRPPVGAVGHVEGNFGGVVSDEPRAALVGRDVLSSGGNAVDAVISMYFTLAVTYPGAATLGGGGVCVVHSPVNGAVEAIDFTPAFVPAAGSRRAIAVPGSVRGMFALHARYGRLAWERLLLPAEQIARFGEPVSRALSRHIAQWPDAVRRDPPTAAVFAPGGTPLAEGKVLRQVQLASTLARIRLRGPGDFYSGDLAKTLARGLESMAGSDVDPALLRGYRPTWLTTVTAKIGNHDLHLPALPGGAASALAARIESGGDGASSAAGSGPAASAGFAAIDIAGGVAACTVSANAPFGAGALIGGTGVLAAEPAPRADAVQGLVPMILVNRARKDGLGALTASGEGAVAAAPGIARRVFADGTAPAAAYAAPRPGAQIGVIHCRQGIIQEPEECLFAADPKGHGLAAGAGF